jgi:mono/diheme cytochrome c family protein
LKNYAKNIIRRLKVKGVSIEGVKVKANSIFVDMHSTFCTARAALLNPTFSKLCTLTFTLFTFYFLASCQDQQAVKRDQYLAEGFGHYQTYCANCHGKDGQGLAGLYPRIDANYLKDKNKLAVWIKFGQHEAVVIDGKTYTRPMPGNAALKELEIAEVITYVTNTWGQETTLWPTDSVAAALEAPRRLQQ